MTDGYYQVDVCPTAYFLEPTIFVTLILVIKFRSELSVAAKKSRRGLRYAMSGVGNKCSFLNHLLLISNPASKNSNSNIDKPSVQMNESGTSGSLHFFANRVRTMNSTVAKFVPPGVKSYKEDDAFVLKNESSPGATSPGAGRSIKRMAGLWKAYGRKVRSGSKFFSEPRSFSWFTNGKCVRHDNVQLKYCCELSFSSDRSIYGQFSPKVLGSAVEGALYNGLWTAILEFVFFYVWCYHEEAGPYFTSILQSVSDLQSKILPLISFLITVFLSAKMAKFDEARNWCISVASSIESVAGAVSAHTFLDVDGGVALKYKVYRYLSALHILVHLSNIQARVILEPDDLVQMELLTPEELSYINKSCKTADREENIDRYWLAVYVLLYQTLEQEAVPVLTPNSRISFDHYLRQLQSTCSAEYQQRTNTEPVSFIQLVFGMVELFVKLTPVSFMLLAVGSTPIYVTSMLGGGVLYLVFMGMANLARVIDNPFGADLDHLNIIALLSRTDYGVKTILSISAKDLATNASEVNFSDFPAQQRKLSEESALKSLSKLFSPAKPSTSKAAAAVRHLSFLQALDSPSDNKSNGEQRESTQIISSEPAGAKPNDELNTPPQSVTVSVTSVAEVALNAQGESWSAV
ncbi:hypothetical protein CYMTET_10166 [Cymbomonas tetramitiformis]|uniref:Uncharacterized protein n=1 Tax=Cymbomonas tetramitiformis TaxID=36881 RepID=A0AAE0LEA4_9CHLO|nr:hypothetical protein CYMTET_10166 [Cymbomonas tetramitiformis]